MLQYIVLWGVVAATKQPLIVGGIETRPDEYRFTVGLRQYKSDRNICAGALISRRFVLTAAHCVDAWNHEPSWVALGSHYLSGSSD